MGRLFRFWCWLRTRHQPRIVWDERREFCPRCGMMMDACKRLEIWS